MDTETVNFVTNIATQLPLLVLFVWYNDRMLRMFRAEQDKRDAMYLEAIERVSAKVDRVESKTDRIDDRLAAHDTWERDDRRQLAESAITQRRRSMDK